MFNKIVKIENISVGSVGKSVIAFGELAEPAEMAEPAEPTK